MLNDNLDSALLATVSAIAIYAIPYLLLSLVIIFVQSFFVNWTIKGVALCILTILTAVLLPIFFKKLNQKLKKYFAKRMNRWLEDN